MLPRQARLGGGGGAPRFLVWGLGFGLTHMLLRTSPPCRQGMFEIFGAGHSRKALVILLVWHSRNTLGMLWGWALQDTLGLSHWALKGHSEDFSGMGYG